MLSLIKKNAGISDYKRYIEKQAEGAFEQKTKRLLGENFYC